jgi:hypothetical protein
MKKALFLAGTLLMLTLHQVFAMPAKAGSAQTLHPGRIIESSINKLHHPTLIPVAKMANGMLKVAIRQGSETLTDAYVWLGYINEYQSGPGLYGDVAIRVYEDLNATIPYSPPSGLLVNYEIVGYVEGSGGYNIPSSVSVYSSEVIIAYNQEHDYDDGTQLRWKDFYLRPGDYFPLS